MYGAEGGWGGVSGTLLIVRVHLNLLTSVRTQVSGQKPHENRHCRFLNKQGKKETQRKQETF